MIRPRATASPLNFCINTFVSSGHFAHHLLSRAHLPYGTRWDLKSLMEYVIASWRELSANWISCSGDRTMHVFQIDISSLKSNIEDGYITYREVYQRFYLRS